MNYYNPYFSLYPYASVPTSTGTGLLSGLFRNGFNFSSILTNTQKALNVVNQAIPVIKQVSPIMKNAKTMFRVMNEFKKVDTDSNTTTNNNEIKDVNETKNTENNYQTYDNGPTFFV